MELKSIEFSGNPVEILVADKSLQNNFLKRDYLLKNKDRYSLTRTVKGVLIDIRIGLINPQEYLKRGLKQIKKEFENIHDLEKNNSNQDISLSFLRFESMLTHYENILEMMASARIDTQHYQDSLDVILSKNKLNTDSCYEIMRPGLKQRLKAELENIYRECKIEYRNNTRVKGQETSLTLRFFEFKKEFLEKLRIAKLAGLDTKKYDSKNDKELFGGSDNLLANFSVSWLEDEDSRKAKEYARKKKERMARKCRKN